MVAVAGIAFVMANRSEVPATMRAIRQSQPAYLCIGLLLSAVALANQIALHSSAQRAAGVEVSALELARPVAATGFLNLVVKSGAMAGLAPLLAAARRRKSGRGNTIAGYLLVNLFGHVAFTAALTASLLVLIIDGRFTRVDGIATFVFVVLTSVQVFALVAAMRSRNALRRVYTLPRRIADAVRRRKQVEVSDGAFRSADELFDAVQHLRSKPRAALRVLLFAFGVEAIGMTQLWCVLRAVGQQPRVVVPVVAYAVSVLFAIVGFLPGGLGFVEAGLGAVLVSFGLTGATAAAAVVLYRVLELWIPVIVGALAAHGLARETYL
jgi:uncharacterized protein (TIRG00374 family)